MNGVITCSVKEAAKLMEHLNEDDLITLTIIDNKTHIHTQPKKIKKKNGEKLINKEKTDIGDLIKNPILIKNKYSCGDRVQCSIGLVCDCIGGLPQ